MLFLGLIWLKLLDKETLQSTAPALLLMFHLQQCELCGLSSVLRQYPATPDYCVHCSQLRCKEKISTVLKVLKSEFDHFCSDPAVMLEALFHRINIPIDLVSCEVISSFLVPSIRQVQFEHSSIQVRLDEPASPGLVGPPCLLLQRYFFPVIMCFIRLKLWRLLSVYPILT